MALSLGLDPDYEVVAMTNTLDTVRSSHWGPRLTRWVAVGHVGVAGARVPVWGPHLSPKPLLCCLLYLREVLSIGAFLGRTLRLGLLLQ